MILGAHVSTSGGIHLAPARGADIGATAIQVFTKSPNQWRDPALPPDAREALAKSMSNHDIWGIFAHDSYLINMASPDPTLNAKSRTALEHELHRCETLGIPYLVSHPGNYIDDREAGIRRNARGYTECLERVGDVRVLLETTAGCGTSLGSNFEELAELRACIPASLRPRVGFCADTCHLYSAGYDLVNDYDSVWQRWDSVIGLEHLHCFHLNDSKTSFHSCRDRHELIAEGSLGPRPFRRIMTDPRFERVMKVIETPKGEDLVTLDRKMLKRLRIYARGALK